MDELLQVSDLRAGYGQSEVIPKLSIGAKQGEIVAVMGLNGMGKTTLMKTLIGILPLRAGSIRLEGHELSQKAPFERVKDGLAYVPQGRMVFPSLTVEENIKTGLRGSGEVPKRLYGYFPVLEEMKRRRGGNLSGGQQQQLVIARALAAKPRVLLLDEPTEGIQPSIIKDLARVLRQIRDEEKLTILVSEQVLSFALSVADRIAVLDRGRLVHDGPRAELDEERLGRMLAI